MKNSEGAFKKCISTVASLQALIQNLYRHCDFYLHFATAGLTLRGGMRGPGWLYQTPVAQPGRPAHFQFSIVTLQCDVFNHSE